MTEEFYTVHRKKDHSAHRLSGEFIVPSQPTEIELVRKLALLGIKIDEYDYYNNRGDENFLTTNWRPRNGP